MYVLVSRVAAALSVAAVARAAGTPRHLPACAALLRARPAAAEARPAERASPSALRLFHGSASPQNNLILGGFAVAGAAVAARLALTVCCPLRRADARVRVCECLCTCAGVVTSARARAVAGLPRMEGAAQVGEPADHDAGAVPRGLRGPDDAARSGAHSRRAVRARARGPIDPPRVCACVTPPSPGSRPPRRW